MPLLPIEPREQGPAAPSTLELALDVNQLLAMPPEIAFILAFVFATMEVALNLAVRQNA